MHIFLLLTQMIISILLMLLVLTQNKDAGLSAFMGGSESFRSTRRGPEKILFNTTIVLAALFLINALAFAFV